MTTETSAARAQRAPGLLGQTVVVIGGSANTLQDERRSASSSPREERQVVEPGVAGIALEEQVQPFSGRLNGARAASVSER